MKELEIEGQHYRVGKLPLRIQFHVARKLLPLVARVAPIALALEKGKVPELGIILQSIGPAVHGLSELSDADCDYVINECMKACQTKRDRAWHQLWNFGADCPQYNDGTLTMFAMIRLVYEAIAESGLLTFSSGMFPNMNDPASLPPSNS